MHRHSLDPILRTEGFPLASGPRFRETKGPQTHGLRTEGLSEPRLFSPTDLPRCSLDRRSSAFTALGTEPGIESPSGVRPAGRSRPTTGTVGRGRRRRRDLTCLRLAPVEFDVDETACVYSNPTINTLWIKN